MDKDKGFTEAQLNEALGVLKNTPQPNTMCRFCGTFLYVDEEKEKEILEQLKKADANKDFMEGYRAGYKAANIDVLALLNEEETDEIPN